MRAETLNKAILPMPVFAAVMFFACCGSAASGMSSSGFRMIMSLSTNAEGVVFVLDGANVTPNASCVNTFVVANNAPDSVLLKKRVHSAYDEGKRVNVLFLDAETDCHVLAHLLSVE